MQVRLCVFDWMNARQWHPFINKLLCGMCEELYVMLNVYEACIES
jgi:hypothetical protein